jgi:hypothetical protein
METVIRVRASEGIMVDGVKYKKDDELVVSGASAKKLAEEKKAYPIGNAANPRTFNGRAVESR